MTEQVTHKRLSSGLQSFTEASPEYELAPLGIASMHDQAQRLAEYGRNGDIYVIHAAEGETVIPMEVLDANPQIKQLLFSQMKEMGLDPQEFVVGNELNSINPVTGLPEFFFKSIFRSVKKAVKKVFKVAKKLAPVIIPLAIGAFGLPFLGGTALGTIFGPGTAASAALGSGLGSLAGGGSMKDAFKSALIGGGVATLSGGLARGFQANPDQFGTEFMKGAGQTLTGVKAPIGEYIQQGTDYLLGDKAAASPLEKKVFNVRGGVGPQNAHKVSLQSAPTDFYGGMTSDLSAPTGGSLDKLGKLMKKSPSYVEGIGMVDAAGKPIQSSPFLTTVAGKAKQKAAEPTILDQVGDWMFRGGQSKTDIARAGNKAAQKAYQDYMNTYKTLSTDTEVIKGALKAGEAARAAAGPGLVAQYGPMAAAGLGAAYAGGMFDPPKVEEVPEDPRLTALSGPSGADLVAADPSKYQIPVDPLTYADQLRTGQGILQPSIYASHGGMIQGPGTGTSDDIPGWLSDGEFVLTEKAVRGADPSGRGDRMAGADNLYSIMRDFEMRA
jgi:hypothetical protein